MLVRILINNDLLDYRNINNDKKTWYSDLNGEIINIEDVSYIYINNLYISTLIKVDYPFWNKNYMWRTYYCKLITNLNKNKNIIVNEKFKYIKIKDIEFLTKKEERLYKLNKLQYGTY